MARPAPSRGARPGPTPSGVRLEATSNRKLGSESEARPDPRSFVLRVRSLTSTGVLPPPQATATPTSRRRRGAASCSPTTLAPRPRGCAGERLKFNFRTEPSRTDEFSKTPEPKRIESNRLTLRGRCGARARSRGRTGARIAHRIRIRTLVHGNWLVTIGRSTLL